MGTSPDAASPAPEGGPGEHDVTGARLFDLVGVVDTLRTACPWDREQTHASLLRYLLEEAYEAAETIEDGDMPALREEIGDVLFQVLFHARIASERSAADGGFTIDDVADTLAAKLVRRHPHVFGSVSVSSAADVNANWEEIKKAERAAKAAAAAGSADPAPVARLVARWRLRCLMGCRSGSLRCRWPPNCSGARRGRVFPCRSMALVPRGSGGSADSDDDAGLTGERLGAELMALVARAQVAGLDPELELRAAARRFADEAREQERRL